MQPYGRKTLVRDVMTQHVHVVSPSTPFKVVVGLIEDNQVSGLPVVDGAGKVVGIVSEADLLLKAEMGRLGRERHPLDLPYHRRERRKSEALTAAELMTSPAIGVNAEATLREAAVLMHGNGVMRLIVTDDADRLVGIVSRSDLLKVFMRSDDEIRAEVAGVAARMLGASGAALQVSVDQGVVTLGGQLPRRTDGDLIRILAGRLDGVVGVKSSIRFDEDDLGRVIASPVMP